MKSAYILFLTLVMVVFLVVLIPQARADDVNGISIQNMVIQPYDVKVGDAFTVTATLINNSTVPIVVDGGKCSAQDTQAEIFTMIFDNHVKNKAENINCAGVGWSQIVDPGKNITATSPDYTTNYVAAESGTATITGTFSYHAIIQRDPIQTGDEQTISKSFQFQIHDVNSDSSGLPIPIPGTISPLQQFKSGIPADEVKCNDGFLLTFKADDGSPACVKLDTKIQLLKIGWAVPGPKDFGYNPGRGPLAFHDPQSDDMNYHGLPRVNGVTIFYNGTTLSDNVVFDAKQGQNMTLMLDVISNSVNTPVTLYTAPHSGFTKTNGIDFKLSNTMVNTPATVILHMPVSKDATPSTYGATVKANDADLGSVTYRFFVTVK